MGGGHYDGDVAERARSVETEHFGYSGVVAGSATRRVHPLLDVKGPRLRECRDSPEHPTSTPIVVAMDVTRSRGDDAKVVFAKLPMLIGQIIMRGYVPDPTISFAAIGDATADRAPIQVGQFESDNRLDEELSSLWLEEGGGGTGQESYELTAYYYGRHTRLDATDRGKKGFFFFLGDESFYPVVSAAQVKEWIGDEIAADLPAADAFSALADKFHVFLIYPRKSWQERVADIDAEIRARLKEAGGRFLNVDIRASLLWNNRNDLDLHVMTPSGFHIYYGDKSSPCGGELDVDRNVSGNTTKPVENIRWPTGAAQPGHYQVFVRNFRFHEKDHGATPFRVELEVNGAVRHFEGETGAGKTGGASEVVAFELDYDPSARVIDKKLYEGYDDETIKRQWTSVLAPDHVLEIDDPNAIVDVLLGTLAVVSGTADLDTYSRHMVDRGQTEERVGQVVRTLSPLATMATAAPVAVAAPPAKRGKKPRSSSTRRL
ncbi:MAG: hypothetical protein HYV63_31145 [Candidatus Schekmanbacteria bacterium]|nr:hypothetical protein [Candidatus Schekmanbacteria bacterium]